jgi:hypothetical protein
MAMEISRNIMKGKINKNFLISVICCSILILITVAFLVFVIKTDRGKYDEVCNNIPTQVWLEEDLENVFLTKLVDVSDIELNGKGCIVVKARANYDNNYYDYICVFEVNGKLGYSYQWKLKRYILC